MLNIGGWELMIILLVALVFLGPERLPTVARQVGQTVSSLRSMAAGFQAEMEAATKSATDAMTLDGPTSQDEAIAKTQQRAGAVSSEVPSDPFDLKAKARRAQEQQGDDVPVSDGGPSDLRDGDMAGDEEE